MKSPNLPNYYTKHFHTTSYIVLSTFQLHSTTLPLAYIPNLNNWFHCFIPFLPPTPLLPHFPWKGHLPPPPTPSAQYHRSTNVDLFIVPHLQREPHPSCCLSSQHAPRTQRWQALQTSSQCSTSHKEHRVSFPNTLILWAPQRRWIRVCVYHATLDEGGFHGGGHAGQQNGAAERRRCGIDKISCKIWKRLGHIYTLQVNVHYSNNEFNVLLTSVIMIY